MPIDKHTLLDIVSKFPNKESRNGLRDILINSSSEEKWRNEISHIFYILNKIDNVENTQQSQQTETQQTETQQTETQQSQQPQQIQPSETYQTEKYSQPLQQIQKSETYSQPLQQIQKSETYQQQTHSQQNQEPEQKLNQMEIMKLEYLKEMHSIASNTKEQMSKYNSK